jgi:hypothetical protein
VETQKKITITPKTRISLSMKEFARNNDKKHTPTEPQRNKTETNKRGQQPHLQQPSREKLEQESEKYITKVTLKLTQIKHETRTAKPPVRVFSTGLPATDFDCKVQTSNNNGQHRTTARTRKSCSK